MSLALSKEEMATHAMKQAMAWLNERAIPYVHLPPYQLKIDALNFWPRTGTITIDGEQQRRTEKGLDGLETILFSKASPKPDARGRATKFFFE